MALRELSWPKHDRTPPWVADASAVFLGWASLVGVELILLGSWLRSLLTGNWEVAEARRLVAPIALAMLAPAAVACALFGHLVLARAGKDARARLAVTLLVAVASASVAYGVSTGRHLQAPPVRAGFIAAIAAAGAGVGRLLPTLLARLDARMWSALGFFVAAAAWMADVGILPRLYPAFHTALFVVLLLATAAMAAAVVRIRPWHGGRLAVAGGALLAAVLSAGLAPSAAQRLRLADNLRVVLVERTSALARAVELAAALAPPPPLADPRGGAEPQVGDIPRALDWSGHDVLLISIDALRADHVSSYGYSRPTTPNLDALAREGVRFEDAYCPTPNTSYSVTSLMTGKAIRPLMTLGLGADSETWALMLRRYGYRTAAFYPPAIFYIDAERFGTFETRRLDFEYAKVQFSSAHERVDEVARYLAGAPRTPVFLWVHLFEPHEPYVMHPAYAFGGADPRPMDAYDSEVAYVDSAVGELVTLVRARRPGVAIVVTADHGEEFGEHGGRYHGTSCYEEQVRVPLVVVGPGVKPRATPIVAQTIDVLPTVLSAIGTPRPARVRGRDLGPILAGTVGDEDPGLAYAEAGDYAMVARGSYRLVCARRAAACRLYDVVGDPGERLDMSTSRPQAARELRGVLAGIERATGRYEAEATSWPDPIRRGLQRAGDAASDVAALLDDASAPIRRKAAEVMFLLHAAEVAPETRRALLRDEDPEVQKWCALALVRMGDPPPAKAEAALTDSEVVWRRRAALAFGSRGDPRGAAELATYYEEEAPPRGHLDVEEAKEVLATLARLRTVQAVRALVGSLSFVPLRPFVADALGAIGDVRARAPLLALLAAEPYETARSHEARALLALGVKRELLPLLTRFAGLPEPMIDAVSLARDAGLLEPAAGGVAPARPSADLEARVTVAVDGPLRLLVLSSGDGGQLSGFVGGAPLGPGVEVGAVHIRELVARPHAGAPVELRLHDERGLLAAWVVPRAEAPLVAGGDAGAGTD